MLIITATITAVKYGITCARLSGSHSFHRTIPEFCATIIDYAIPSLKPIYLIK